MNRAPATIAIPVPTARKCTDLDYRLAQSLEGRAVCVMVDTQTIAHGVVTSVFTETGVPKIVIEGLEYDLDQILTATPLGFAQQTH